MELTKGLQTILSPLTLAAESSATLAQASKLEESKTREMNSNRKVTVNAQMTGVLLTVVNDLQGQAIPFLQLQLDGLSFGFFEELKRYDLHAMGQACLSFLNLQNGLWEPVLERTQLKLEGEKFVDEHDHSINSLRASIESSKSDKTLEDAVRTVNLNFTQEFLQECMDTVSLLSQGDYSNKKRQKPRLVFSNQCGFPVLFSLSARQIDFPSRILEDRKALYVDEDPLLCSLLNYPVSDIMLTISLLNGEWDTIHDLKICKRGRQSIPLIPVNPDSPWSLCVESLVSSTERRVVISSSYLIQNFTNYAFQIAGTSSVRPGVPIHEIGILEPHGHISIPLPLCGLKFISFTAIMLSEPFLKFKPSSFLYVQNLVASFPAAMTWVSRCPDDEKSLSPRIVFPTFSCCAKFLMSSKSLTISVYHPISLSNQLPVPFTVEVLSSDKSTVFVRSIESGGSIDLENISFEDSPSFRLLIERHHPSVWCRIERVLKPAIETIQLLDSFSRPNYLKFESRPDDKFPSKHALSLFTSYWFIDNTGLDVFFGYSIRLGETPISVPNQIQSTRVTILEHQRLDTGMRWSEPFLSTDPPSFSDSRCRKCPKPHEFKLPDGWTWKEDEWILDSEDAAEDGWQYAHDFHLVFRAFRKPDAMVRRRKWLRTRIATESYPRKITFLGLEEQCDTFVSAKVGDSLDWSDAVCVSSGPSKSKLVFLEDERRGPAQTRFDISSYFRMGPSPFFLTKFVYFEPRFVVTNATGRNILVRQDSSTRGNEVASDTGLPVYFLASNSTFSVSISFEGFDWSPLFTLDQIGVITVAVKRISAEEILYIDVNIRVIQATNVARLTFRSENNPPYLIENCTRHSVRFYQVSPYLSSRNIHTAGPGQKVSFSWDDLQQQTAPLIELDFGSPRLNTRVKLDDLGFRNILKAPPTFISLLIVSDKTSRVLRIDNVMRIDNEAPVDIQFAVSFPLFGVSFMGPRNRELLYAFMKDIEVITTLSPQNFKVRGSMTSMQIDACDTSYSSPFPVALNLPPGKSQPAVQFRVNKIRGNPSLSHFQYFGFLVQPISLFLDDRLLDSILRSVLDLLQIGNASMLSPTEIQSILSSYERQKIMFKRFLASSGASSRLYFETLELYQLKMVLSLYSTGLLTGNLTQFGPLASISRSIGIIAMNIKDYTMKISGLQWNQAYVSGDALVSGILEHVKQQLVLQILGILGSVQFLGNPAGLVSHLRIGISDFLSEPAEGFLKGPAEFGLGIAHGSKSLIQHSVYGLGSAVSGVTGTVGSALAELSFDDEFIKQRDISRISDRPTNLLSVCLEVESSLLTCLGSIDCWLKAW
jgi:hypothetical protein